MRQRDARQYNKRREEAMSTTWRRFKNLCWRSRMQVQVRLAKMAFLKRKKEKLKADERALVKEMDGKVGKDTKQLFKVLKDVKSLPRMVPVKRKSAIA